MTTDNNLPAATTKPDVLANLPDLKIGGRGYLIPDSLATQIKMAELIAMSGLAPKGMEKVSTVFTAIQLGSEVGLAPMQAVQSIAVINGRPTIWGDAQLGLVKAHPEYEWIKERVDGSGKNMIATCEVKRTTEPLSTVQSFSYEEAVTAGLLQKEIWKKYTRRMLQMRARGYALRDAFPDVLKGLSITREEAIDMDLVNGEYVAPEVTKVQETVNKAKAPKKDDPKKDPVEIMVDKETGEIKETSEEIPTLDAWDRENWIKLRAAGFRKYVEDNLYTLGSAPEEIQLEAMGKWKNLYGNEPFPSYTDEGEAPEDPFTNPESVPEENTGAPLRVVCPNKDGASVFVDYCNDECPTRTGCPAFGE